MSRPARPEHAALPVKRRTTPGPGPGPGPGRAAPAFGGRGAIVGATLGRVLLALAAAMLVPAAVDALAGNGNGGAFLRSALATAAAGTALVLVHRGTGPGAFDLRAAYLLTFAIWTLLPAFGALPFQLGAPGLSPTDAYFEAVSGITTTGSTMIAGLDSLPAGMNFWRGMLNWIGGLGITFIAMIFLPVMRTGGMQFFRTEGFDTFGKVLPRASDIARELLAVYLVLTLCAVATFAALGMTALDAVVHGMATIATGGFSPRDASFSAYRGACEYAGVVFMLLGAMPYIRLAQAARTGRLRPISRDPQVRAMLRWLIVPVLFVAGWEASYGLAAPEAAFRTALFNLTSILTGTGFFSGDFPAWTGPALTVAFVFGLIGGASGSSSGALSVFRVQLVLAILRRAVAERLSPRRVTPLRHAGRPVSQDVVDSLILFVTAYLVALVLLTVAASLAGLGAEDAIFGVWTSLGNIGYGLGPTVGTSGTFAAFPEAAKWVMILAMILGRLGLLAIVVLLLPRFWQP